MFAHTNACVVLGATAVPVVVEASATRGLPALQIIGLRAHQQAETRERVRAGLTALGIDPGLRRIVVSIAPADVPKSGAALDLPIAIAVLASLGAVPRRRIERLASHGEVGLDGGLRKAHGVVAAAFGATRARGVEAFLTPSENADRAAIAPMSVVPVDSLQEVVAYLKRRRSIEPASPPAFTASEVDALDLADVRSQPTAVEATIVAAAGGHNLLLYGPPGCGKTMLAQRISTILPPLDRASALEVATIHDAAGLRDRRFDLRPPFRAPHHTVSTPALVGGGSGTPVVGELTLAHRGVLFLDEFPEFRPTAIDSLRQPLEDHEVRVRRSTWMVRYPCRTQLVAAMNLCRCGRAGTEIGAGCSCSEASLRAYQDRVSGAVLDRFDVRVRMHAPAGSLLDTAPTIDSATASERVANARRLQEARWGPGRLNGSMSNIHDRRFSVSARARRRLERVVSAQPGGGRMQRGAVRVARTIADLEDVAEVSEDHVLEALELCRTAPEKRHRD